VQEINVYFVVRRPDARMLVLKRKNGIWEFPGGGVAWGEAPEAAAKRETKEETNLDVEIESLIGVTSATFRKAGRQKHAVYIVYEGTGGGELKISREHTEARWVDEKEAARLRLGYNAAPVLAMLRKNI